MVQYTGRSRSGSTGGTRRGLWFDLYVADHQRGEKDGQDRKRRALA